MEHREALYQDLADKKPIDLLFLDIELVSTSGIQIGKRIRNELENPDISIAYISSKAATRWNFSRFIR